MYSIKDFEEYGMTLPLLQRLRRQVMKVNYNKGSEDEESEGRRRLKEKTATTTVLLGDGSVSGQESTLIDWKFVEFTNLHLKLKLIFSNPLYVSAEPVKELVDVKILKPEFFIAKKDGALIQDGFQVPEYALPSMVASQADFEAIGGAVASATDSLLFTFVIPLFFMVFMSVSMNRVWGLYLML